MPLINCKVECSLRYNENCVLSNVAGNSNFTITDAKLYVPTFTLSAEDNAKLSELLTKGFKSLVYWNEYKVIPEERYDASASIRKLFDPGWQGINNLFVLACLNDPTFTVKLHRKYFLPRVEIKNYNF